MSDSIAERRKMPLLFTAVDSKVFELDPKDLPPTSNLLPDNMVPNTTPIDPPAAPEYRALPILTLDGLFSNPPGSPIFAQTPRSRCGTPLIEIIAPDQMPNKAIKPVAGSNSPHICDVSTNLDMVGFNNAGINVPMCYDEYGELMPASTTKEHQTPEDLTVLQLLRVIRKAYHHDLRNKLGNLLNPQPDPGDSALSKDNIWSYRLTCWNLRDRTPISASSLSPASQPCPDSVRRVLELGASDGDWCFAISKQLPGWAIHGVDDTDHWACLDRGVPLQDFMRSPRNYANRDYFSQSSTSTSLPEFTKRNLNCLLMHKSPLPKNHYEFIHGRGIFERIESYKTFLEDIRCLLRPDGVVEFIEEDPRPRLTFVSSGTKDNEKASNHGSRRTKRSTAATDWTDSIEDRFKDPLDQELATDVPGWSDRVAQRMNAYWRPRDGVPAANLKSWLEGSGFWDVKQFILPIPVGGPTKNGNFLKEYLMYQLELENCIPKLRAELPEVELDAMQSGKYYLNIHIVTARKPIDQRTGDIMPNGQRREMTHSTYDTMAKFDAIKCSQWKRYDFQGGWKGFMQNLTTLTGAPEAFHLSRGNTPDALQLVGRHPDTTSPFNAPPFVTYEMGDRKRAENDI